MDELGKIEKILKTFWALMIDKENLLSNND